LDQSERDDVPLRPTNTLADASAYSRLTANSPLRVILHSAAATSGSQQARCQKATRSYRNAKLGSSASAAALAAYHLRTKKAPHRAGGARHPGSGRQRSAAGS
jgi:hypothetical protein